MILFSLFPEVIGLADIESPDLFGSAWRVGVLLGYVGFLLVGYRDLVFCRAVWRVVRSRAVSWAMLFWILAFFDIPLYALSAARIDVSVTAILYEVWPIIFVALMGSLFMKEGRYLKVGPSTPFAFFLAVLGVALVITSQVGGFDQMGELGGASVSGLSLGILLALAAAVMTALSGFRIQMGCRHGPGVA